MFPSIVQKRISDVEVLEVIPIHHCQDLAKECSDLINSEWPRSTAARLQSLFMSSDTFPTSLVLILNENIVVGHVKLSEIRIKGPEIMLESMIIHKNHRRKGWGKVLMEAAEKFVEGRGKEKIYLSTKGQEGFYKKLGYEICPPIMYFGFCDLTPKGEEKVEIKNGFKTVPREVKSVVPLPPPPPPPPLPKSMPNKSEIYKTSKTFLSKNLNPQ